MILEGACQPRQVQCCMFYSVRIIPCLCNYLCYSFGFLRFKHVLKCTLSRFLNTHCRYVELAAIVLLLNVWHVIFAY